MSDFLGPSLTNEMTFVGTYAVVRSQSVCSSFTDTLSSRTRRLVAEFPNNVEASDLA